MDTDVETSANWGTNLTVIVEGVSGSIPTLPPTTWSDDKLASFASYRGAVIEVSFG